MILPEASNEAFRELIVRSIAAADSKEAGVDKMRERPDDYSPALVVGGRGRVDDRNANPSDTSVSAV